MSEARSSCPLCGSILNALFGRSTFQSKADSWLNRVGFLLKWLIWVYVIVANLPIYILLAVESIFKFCGVQVFRLKESACPLNPARSSFRFLSMFSLGGLDPGFNHFQTGLGEFSELTSIGPNLRDSMNSIFGSVDRHKLADQFILGSKGKFFSPVILIGRRKNR